MVKPVINMLASEISHMPLLFVWRDSEVTQEQGFDLVVHVANAEVSGQPFMSRWGWTNDPYRLLLPCG